MKCSTTSDLSPPRVLMSEASASGPEEIREAPAGERTGASVPAEEEGRCPWITTEGKTYQK